MTATDPPAPADPPSPLELAEASATAADFLSRVQGSGELIATLLALLLPAGSERALRVWQAETEATPNAGAVLAQVASLLPNARLP